jgi:hypothetical protein
MNIKTKRVFLVLLLLIILFVPLISFAETLDPPKININIPTLEPFKPVNVVPGESVVIPWLVDYIVAIYRYGLIIAAVFTVIAFMISGILYLSAGGLPENISKAKKISFSAITGVILLVFSYLILYTVNPNLVELKPLVIDTMQADALNYVQTDFGSPGTPKNPKALADTTFDTLFQNYAACLPTDWRILKVMAYKESALDPNVVNSKGFTGLFQTKQEFCESTLNKYPTMKAKCNNLTDPDVNTAVGTMMLKSNVNAIRKACPLPQATPRVQLALLYIGHNSGGGAMKNIMKKGCTEAQLGPAMDYFWKTYQGGKNADLNTNNKKWTYPLTVADLMLAQGVQSMDGTGGGSCPLK